MKSISIRLLATLSIASAMLVAVGGGAAEAGIFWNRLPRHPAPPTAPALGSLTVDSRSLTRGEFVQVAGTGCAEDFQYVEVRLVVRIHGARTSAVVTAADAEGSTFTVPSWVPTGGASIEASCLEANLSGASDGADIWRFDYAPVRVWVERSPRVERPPSLSARFDARSGLLHVTGSPCEGRVLVSVAKGRDLVASSDRFHYGRTLITAAPDGTWSAAIPARYAVSEFVDPVAPGHMAAFAVCEGTQYPGERFVVSGRAESPAIHVLSWNPGGVFVAQCSPLNTLTIEATTQGASGMQREVRRVAGHEFGESFEFFDLPADATSVTYRARCSGRSGPAFKYEPASVTIT